MGTNLYQGPQCCYELDTPGQIGPQICGRPTGSYKEKLCPQHRPMVESEDTAGLNPAAE